jgi:hypothetical protein
MPHAVDIPGDYFADTSFTLSQSGWRDQAYPSVSCKASRPPGDLSRDTNSSRRLDTVGPSRWPTSTAGTPLGHLRHAESVDGNSREFPIASSIGCVVATSVPVKVEPCETMTSGSDMSQVDVFPDYTHDDRNPLQMSTSVFSVSEDEYNTAPRYTAPRFHSHSESRDSASESKMHDSARGVPVSQEESTYQEGYTDSIPFTCDLCNMMFNDVNAFREHMSGHGHGRGGGRKHISGHGHGRGVGRDKHFMCPSCGKAFGTKVLLGVHRRIHSDERPYACSFCSKRFRDSSGQVKHMRTHTGERPYTCHVCGRGFVQSTHLKTHLLSHRHDMK